MFYHCSKIQGTTNFRDEVKILKNPAGSVNGYECQESALIADKYSDTVGAM